MNLFETYELCTHNLPNKIQLVNYKHDFELGPHETYKIQLKEGFKLEAIHCPDQCHTEVITGHWTTIYDQALNVELDNGLRFVSNFRYTIKNEISDDLQATVR